MTTQSDWNPDQACEEMAEVFQQVNEIFNQPHYQGDVSADEVQNPSADASPTTEANES